MNAPIATDGGWVWVAKPNGAVILATTDGLPVMDCIRKSMQACVPRFAEWPGLAEGRARAGRVGTMRLAHSWLDPQGNVLHPDARLIQASPALLFALRAAQSKLAEAMAPGPTSRSPAQLVADAHELQSIAISFATGRQP